MLKSCPPQTSSELRFGEIVTTLTWWFVLWKGGIIWHGCQNDLETKLLGTLQLHVYKNKILDLFLLDPIFVDGREKCFFQVLLLPSTYLRINTDLHIYIYMTTSSLPTCLREYTVTWQSPSLCSVSTPCCALICLYTPGQEYPDHAEATVFSSPFTADWQPSRSPAHKCISPQCVCVCVCRVCCMGVT